MMKSYSAQKKMRKPKMSILPSSIKQVLQNLIPQPRFTLTFMTFAKDQLISDGLRVHKKLETGDWVRIPTSQVAVSRSDGIVTVEHGLGGTQLLIETFQT